MLHVVYLWSFVSRVEWHALWNQNHLSTYIGTLLSVNPWCCELYQNWSGWCTDRIVLCPTSSTTHTHSTWHTCIYHTPALFPPISVLLTYSIHLHFYVQNINRTKALNERRTSFFLYVFNLIKIDRSEQCMLRFGLRAVWSLLKYLLEKVWFDNQYTHPCECNRITFSRVSYSGEIAWFRLYQSPFWFWQGDDLSM